MDLYVSDVPDGSWPIRETIRGMSWEKGGRSSAGWCSVGQSSAGWSLVKLSTSRRVLRSEGRPPEGVAMRRGSKRVAMPPRTSGGVSIRDSPPPKHHRQQVVESRSSDDEARAGGIGTGIGDTGGHNRSHCTPPLKMQARGSLVVAVARAEMTQRTRRH